MSEIALKGCPLCGGTVRYWTSQRRHGFSDAIECDNDNCEVSLIAKGSQSSDELIAQWNRRVPTQP